MAILFNPKFLILRESHNERNQVEGYMNDITYAVFLLWGKVLANFINLWGEPYHFIAVC